VTGRPRGEKSEKIFWGVGGFWGVFWRVATAFAERQGGLGVWKGPFGVKNALVSRDYGPDLPRKWAITAPVLPRKTLVLATMLWSVVDGIGGFSRSLARDLHAGGRGKTVQSSRFKVPSDRRQATRLRRASALQASAGCAVTLNLELETWNCRQCGPSSSSTSGFVFDYAVTSRRGRQQANPAKACRRNFL